MPHLEENFLRVLQDHTAGDPMRQEVKWTDLTSAQIAERLAEAGTPASVSVVEQLLNEHGYVDARPASPSRWGSHADRNAQFQNIARLKQEFLGTDNPILSIDTKKKELLGNFFRDGPSVHPADPSRLSTTTSPVPPRA